MTCNYTLAEKLKSQFYIRDEAMRCSCSSFNTRGRRRSYRPVSGIRSEEAVRAAAKRAPRQNSVKRTAGPEITPVTEIKVKKKIINPLFVAALLVVTLMMMALVMNFSEVFETANVVAELENELEMLQSEKTDLALQLEEKNDLREIEIAATTRLGMVKEDSLQKRFVSLSEGEHIVIAETEEPAEQTTGGVMLSSLFSSIGRFFDNFR